jgi:protein involved in polysaccharide export with SLBB domain
MLAMNLFCMLNVLDFSPILAQEGKSEEARKTGLSKYYESNRDSRITFAPGSAIQVTIWQEPDLSGSFSIDSQGYVILPLIGKINISRFTSESLESYLKEEYSSYLRNPIIQTLPLVRISVLGHVREPGLYRVEPDRPLWDVIELAGGPNERGDIMRMVVTRGGKVINNNLIAAYEEGVSLQEVGIKTGDQIIVPYRKGPFPWRTMVSIASLGVSVWAISTRR